MTRIFTGAGDDGTTGLLHGGRIPKDHAVAVAVGDADEAQAAIGVARARARAGGDHPDLGPGGSLDGLLLARQGDLWVVMAELAAGPDNRSKLVGGRTLVVTAMVDAVEAGIHELSGRFDEIRDFVVPGQTELAAALDLARTVVRRAERSAVTALAPTAGGSVVVPYLNRLSALLWAAARTHEGRALLTRDLSARETERPAHVP